LARWWTAECARVSRSTADGSAQRLRDRDVLVTITMIAHAAWPLWAGRT